MVGGVLEANKSWDIGKEVIDCIRKQYPEAYPIRPKVSIPPFNPRMPLLGHLSLLGLLDLIVPCGIAMSY